MDSMTFATLVKACAPLVHSSTAQALVAVESGFNENAIGVVGGSLGRQPRNRDEAVATATALQKSGWSFSVGLSQINVGNFARLGLTIPAAFDTCQNLGAMQKILAECFERAGGDEGPQRNLRRALSCYYSGNFTTGFRHGYVGRVVSAAGDFRTSVRGPPPIAAPIPPRPLPQ